jgi:thioesterase domain-containing protein
MAFEVACLLNESGETIDLLAVIDTGPGMRGYQPRFGDLWTRLFRVVANLPLWLREEIRDFSARRLCSSLARKLRHLHRWLASGGRKSRELDDVIDVSKLPAQNIELMSTVYAAFRDYVSRHYAGKLTLFRANTRSLLSGCSHDLGWGRFVEALDVRRINGNHETILHRPHVNELARQLGALLEDRTPCL